MGRKKRESSVLAALAAKVAHILGDQEVVAHCPFCGSGDIIADSDQTVHCSFCDRAFVVMEQPTFPSTPGQPGVSAPGVLPKADPTDPNNPGGGDPAQMAAPGSPPDASAQPGSPPPSTPAVHPHNPQTDPVKLKAAPPFKMSSSLHESYVAPLVPDQNINGYFYHRGRYGWGFLCPDDNTVIESATEAGIRQKITDHIAQPGHAHERAQPPASAMMHANRVTASRPYRTAAGVKLSETDFVKHLAYVYAGDELR